jgi:hypothetical protein
MIFDRSAVVAVEIYLGVFCLVDGSCHCFAFAIYLVLPKSCYLLTTCFHAWCHADCRVYV